MSVTTKLVIRKDKQKKDGTIPIYIRLTKDRTSRFMATGIYLEEKNWDNVNGKVKKGHSNSVRVNNFLGQKLSEVQNKGFDWELEDKSIKSKSLKKEVAKSSGESFSDYFQAYIAKLKAENHLGTWDKAKATYSKLHTFAKTQNLSFKDIDVDFLKRLHAYLRDELSNKKNTIHGNLKIMRKLFNDAIREEIIQFGQNPFSKFPLETEKSKKEYLTEEDLNKLENIDLSNKPRLNDHRYMFLFSTNAGGVRISDLLQLKWSNISETHVNFTQEKTGENVSIKLTNKALAILEFFKKSKELNREYIFPFLHNELNGEDLFKAISSQTAYANKNLKEIAKLASISKPLTTHIARHTFATRALRKGIRIEAVSKLLGHSSIKTTQVYAKIVNEELDKAMEVFNDFLLAVGELLLVIFIIGLKTGWSLKDKR